MFRFSRSHLSTARIGGRALFVALLASLLFAGARPAAAQVASDEDSVPPVPEPLPDGTDPYAELVEGVEMIDALLESRDVSDADKALLRKARREAEKALELYGNLELDVRARNAQLTVRLRKTVSTVIRLDAALDREAEAIGAQLASAAGLMAERYLEHAAAAGVDRARLDKAMEQYDKASDNADNGAFDKAVVVFGQVYKTVGPDLVFDMDAFEQAIQDRFSDQVVGMAYAINDKGQLDREYAEGWARLPGEPGNDGIHLFGVNTQLMVASVSKNITAVGVMRMLQENGLSPDDSVAPYFPSYWDVHASIQDLTFRDLLTHASGLNGFTGAAGTTRCASTYVGLKACIEAGVDSDDKVFAYQNSNFGIFRLILPYMDNPEAYEQVIDATAGCTGWLVEDACDDLFAATMGNHFETLMQCKVFDKMNLGDPGVAGCADGPAITPRQTPQTLMYSVPGAVENGIATGNYNDSAGGYGWYFSARELAQFEAYRRYSTAVLSKATRSAMDNGYLGWMQPGQYGTWNSGLFGTYRMHGGDWFIGGKDIHTCVVDFPQGIQVSLVINSNAGAGTYQCNALKLAYDAAWVAK